MSYSPPEGIRKSPVKEPFGRERSPGGALKRDDSGPQGPQSASLRVPAGTPAQVDSVPLSLPSGALEEMRTSPTQKSTSGLTPSSAAIAASLQNGSIAFVSEELTFGKWRRDVVDLRALFEEKNAEEETVRNIYGSVSFMLPSPSSAEEDNLNKPCCQGLQFWRPQTYRWITGRMSTSAKNLLVIFLMILEGARLSLAKTAFAPGVNGLSLLVVENFASFVLASLVMLVMEGLRSLEMLSCGQLWRFLLSALCFTLASGLVFAAYFIGTSPVEVVTFGYSYMPICFVLSNYFFNRRYGRLEWLSVGMFTLGVFAFVLLREESREGKELRFEWKGLLLVMGSVFSSATGSILAENVFKERSWVDAKQDRFYIFKFHLDLSAMALAALFWALPLDRIVPVKEFIMQWERTEHQVWFGQWGSPQYLMVLVMVCHGWTAGIITREYSTVIRSIVQTMALLSSWLIGDPLQGARLHFMQRCVPSWLLYLIVIVAALIFQTGRVNLKVVRKACDLSAEANPSLKLGGLAKSEADPNTPKPGVSRKRSSKGEIRQFLKEAATPNAEDGCCMDSKTMQSLCTTYALVVVYVLSDAGRTLILQKALSTTVTNSTVMGLVCYVIGVVVATCLTGFYDGWDGLRRAWSIEKILHCLPAAFLFALATTLGNLGFAMGISPALYLVLGKFYTPVAAFCARWIMGKYYMPLEWFSLIILTLSSAAFGYLQVYHLNSQGPKSAPMTAMAMVVGSAAVSALASLVTEKILKGERDAFHVQKVRLDFGSIISSLVLIPVIGLIATRPQDVPWADRPESYATCPAQSACWDLSVGTCSSSECTCPCTKGLFAGWDSWLMILAVFVNTAQGWLVGKVTHNFSVIHRAIADSFSLLGIYFIGDPLFNGKSLDSSALNLVAMIVPLSTATFTVATTEMRRAFEAQKQMPAGRSRVESVDFDSEDESVMLGSQVHNLSMSVANTHSVNSVEPQET